MQAQDRDFPGTLHSITTISTDNTIRFLSGADAPVTFVLYSPSGRVHARTTMNAKRGPNIIALNGLKSGSPSMYFLEMRIGGQSKGIVRMVKTR
jgi:hypothetical protein